MQFRMRRGLRIDDKTETDAGNLPDFCKGAACERQYAEEAVEMQVHKQGGGFWSE